MKYYKIIVVVLGILITSNAYSQDSTEIYKKYLCKTWRLAESYGLGSDEDGGWNPSTTNYPLDSSVMILHSYSLDNTFKCEGINRSIIRYQDSIIAYSGTWKLNLEKREIVRTVLINQGQSIEPSVEVYGLITLNNDTLKIGNQTISGNCTYTYTPFKGKSKIK